MSLHSWLQNLESALVPDRRRLRHRRRNPIPAAARRPGLEVLEDRSVPATLSIGDISILEGDTGTRSALVTVTLTGRSNSTVSVDYNTANGSAVAGSDYQAVSGKLTFNKGVASKTIAIPINGDAVAEASENLFVNLKNPRHATIADGQGVVAIVNDDTLISIDDVALAEGNSGTTSFDFTISLSTAIGQPVSVNYATANGTATDDTDYAATSGTLTIPAGQTSGTVTVLVNGDWASEPDEDFFVNLSHPTNGVIVHGQGNGTILDDEPQINIEGVSAVEGNLGTTEFTFTVSLSTPSAETVTVDFATADDTATTADNDYTAVAGTLTFAPGETSQTITVLVGGDVLVEYDEYFVVNLSNATNAKLYGTWAIGSILSDDNAVLHIDSVWDVEPSSDSSYYVFNVWLSTAFGETVTIDFQTLDGSAADGWDYLAANGTLTFAPGETNQFVYVLVLPDYEIEWDETFYVLLGNPSSNALVQPGWDTGTGTIWDDDYAWI